MMNKKHSVMLIISGIFIISFLVTGCNSKKNFESVQAMENVTTEGFTLLERTYVDADSDGKNESIELYTSAEISPDGHMGWDTGHQWVLLVRKGEEVFPLFNDWVQYGELQFWVVSFNKDKINGPETTDLEKQIYVMISTDTNISLVSYYWDKQKLDYKKEVIFDPTNQWIVRHSNKYNIPDSDNIESEASGKLPH